MSADVNPSIDTHKGAFGKSALQADFKFSQETESVEIIIEIGSILALCTVKPECEYFTVVCAQLSELIDKKVGVLKSLSEVDAIGHRVLHGGAKYTAPILVDEAVKEGIRDCIVLGPLHNPANLGGIEACEKVFPGVPNVAVFDTAFHQTMGPEAYMYAIPREYYDKYAVRKYGFHGTTNMSTTTPANFSDWIPSRQKSSSAILAMAAACPP